MTPAKPKARFEPVQSKSGRGWLVRVTLAHGRQTQIEGFSKRAEAVAWLEHESGEWLKTYEGGKHAEPPAEADAPGLGDRPRQR